MYDFPSLVKGKSWVCLKTLLISRYSSGLGCSKGPSTTSWRRRARARVIRSLVTTCPDVTQLARAISYLANIQVKILGNVVLARRDSFLAHYKVAGDQQIKNYLPPTCMTHSALQVRFHLWLRSSHSFCHAITSPCTCTLTV